MTTTTARYMTFTVEPAPGGPYGYIVRFALDGKTLPHHPVTFKLFRTRKDAEKAGELVVNGTR